MRAVLMQDRALSVGEVPDPAPGAGEVLVDVLACGICGSDLHSATHAAEFNVATRDALGVELMDLSRPVSFGHEFVGAVAGHGPGTTGALPVGTRVVSVPALVRETPAFLGFCGPELPGGYAERMLLTEALLMPVPDHVDTAVAALTEPLAVAHRAVARAQLGPDDVPLVVGCGPIGLGVIATLRRAGAGPIVAADYSASRRELAGRLGADVVVDPAVTSPYTAWAQAAATDDPARAAPPTAILGALPLRPTVAFECVGVPGVIDQVVASAPAASRIVVAGLCAGPDSFQPTTAVLKEIDIRFSLMYSPEQFAQTFSDVCDGSLDVAPMLSGTVGLDEVPEVFARLSSDPVDTKVLIDPAKIAGRRPDAAAAAAAAV
ncbi:zinc-binding dehydrogenase [Pseudonocardia alni]|uniref:zinc-binding dehydrogenase n=1 Tax=Pseudonocardia alni TaxID=33907 RepID=UPI0033170125